MEPVDFLQQRFVPVGLAHREVLGPFLARYPQELSGYTFAPLIAWQPFFNYVWTLATPELLLVSCIFGESHHRHLLQPIGDFGEEQQARLLEQAKTLPHPLKLFGVTEPFVQAHPRFVEHFEVYEDRNSHNYVYRAQDLAELAGKRFSKKRNLLSQAERLYQWETLPLQPSDGEACLQLLEQTEGEQTDPPDPALKQERTALEFTLRHLGELGQRGTLIKIDGKAVAFSIGERLTPDTAVIHFERALREYKGLYQVINREAARQIAAKGYEFINREEDVGDPGLRQAKLTYNPVRLAKAFTLTFRG